MRWRGRLRGDPLQLPWGTRYEIDLDEVESSAGVTPVTGGLRLTYYSDESASASPPPARAGDRVEALARARPIRNFGDPGQLRLIAAILLARTFNCRARCATASF